MTRPETVVIGVGNAWRGDDAAGPAVVERLRDRVGPCVALVTSDGEPSRLLDSLGLADRVILVDAVRSGAEPGTVITFTGEELPADLGTGQSTHLVDLVDAVSLARVLGRLSGSVEFIGIEGASFEPATPMCPEVEAAVDRTVEHLMAATREAGHA